MVSTVITLYPQANTEVVEQLKLYCGKQPASKRIWKNAVEQHTFFRSHPHTLTPSHTHTLTPSLPHTLTLTLSLPHTLTLTLSLPHTLTLTLSLPHRLHIPDAPNRVNALFRRGSKFRYSGRTLRQTMDGQVRKQHDFQRSKFTQCVSRGQSSAMYIPTVCIIYYMYVHCIIDCRIGNAVQKSTVRSRDKIACVACACIDTI